MKNVSDFDLQLFAEEAQSTAGNGDSAAGEPAPKSGESDQSAPAGKELKYTDDDVDKIINRKFAEWEKKQEKKTAEAERIGKMSTEEQSAERIKTLEERVAGYERDAARAERMKEARTLLDGENIHVSDELLSNLISEEAESTKKSVKSFVKLFRDHVESAVKNAVKRETPRTGSASGITKEQILAIKDRSERQRLINENMSLFQSK